MQFTKALPVIAILAVLFLVASSVKGRAPEKENQVALTPTADTYLGVRNHDDRPEADIQVTCPHGDHWSLSLYDGGLPYQDRTQADANAAKDRKDWTYKYTVHRYTIDYGTDLGSWLGFRSSRATATQASDTGLDCGLRLSPVRLVWGVLAPDILWSPNQVGIGASVYAPAQTVAPFWQHVGLGLGYMADYHGGGGSWMPYASLSTRF